MGGTELSMNNINGKLDEFVGEGNGFHAAASSSQSPMKLLPNPGKQHLSTASGTQKKVIKASLGDIRDTSVAAMTNKQGKGGRGRELKPRDISVKRRPQSNGEYWS